MLLKEGKGVMGSIYLSVHRMINLVVLKYDFKDMEGLMSVNPLYEWTVYGAYLLIGVTAAIFTFSLFIQRIWVKNQKKMAFNTTEDKLYIFGNNPQNIAIYNSDKKRSKFIIDNISDEDGDRFYLNRIPYISTENLEGQLRDLLLHEKKIDLDKERLTQIAQKQFDLNNEYEQSAGILRNLQNQKVYLDNMLKDPLSSTRQGGALAGYRLGK